MRGWDGRVAAPVSCALPPPLPSIYSGTGSSTGREEQPGKRLRRGWGGLWLQRGERRDAERERRKKTLVAIEERQV